LISGSSLLDKSTTDAKIRPEKKYGSIAPNRRLPSSTGLRMLTTSRSDEVAKAPNTAIETKQAHPIEYPLPMALT
jgi:hypothetical protein